MGHSIIEILTQCVKMPISHITVHMIQYIAVFQNKQKEIHMQSTHNLHSKKKKKKAGHTVVSTL